MSHVSPTLPLPMFPKLQPLSPAQEPLAAVELGPCGLPLDPLDPETIRSWELETEIEIGEQIPHIRVRDVVDAPILVDVPILVGGAVQAELSGFEDEDDVGGTDPGPQEGDDDEFDDFDDIDEDDFDDDFDDDFEEELDDDYEIEIEDEISAEFGLSGVVVSIDEIEDIDAVETDVDLGVGLDPGLNTEEKE